MLLLSRLYFPLSFNSIFFTLSSSAPSPPRLGLLFTLPGSKVSSFFHQYTYTLTDISIFTSQNVVLFFFLTFIFYLFIYFYIIYSKIATSVLVFLLSLFLIYLVILVCVLFLPWIVALINGTMLPKLLFFMSRKV